MRTINVSVAIIGGGPAGLAAAIGAYKKGCKSILILERENELGGILNQCIHNGFGLHTFKQELTGPEYAFRYIDQIKELKIAYKTDTTVIDISKDRIITAVSAKEGIFCVAAKAVVIACGCRERPRGAINIAGARCAGIYSAGTAQKYVNSLGRTVGKKVLILGSGDIGLIMARRLKFEGADVVAVVELMPYSSGLNRNIVQCLNDFDIPLLLSHTVTDIKGGKRLQSVTVSKVDQSFAPIEGTQREFEVDTLLLSVGLLPENELSKKAEVELNAITGGAVVDNRFMTSTKGIFSCGNVLHVHDVVDFVSQEAFEAGQNAADFASGNAQQGENRVAVKAGEGVRYVVPQFINAEDTQKPITIKYRVQKNFKEVSAEAAQSGVSLTAKKRKIMTPGEMETIVLTPKILQSLSGDDIFVSVKTPQN